MTEATNIGVGNNIPILQLSVALLIMSPMLQEEEGVEDEYL